jgi:hypothetical protein
LVSDKLEKVSATYYSAYDFQKTQLDDYEEYTYTVEKVQIDQNGNKKVVSSEVKSIFDTFPVVEWENKGNVVEKE